MQKIRVTLRNTEARPAPCRVGGLLLSFEGGDQILRIKDEKTGRLGSDLLPVAFAPNFQSAGETYRVDFVDAPDDDVKPPVFSAPKTVEEVIDTYQLTPEIARVYFDGERNAAKDGLAPYGSRPRLAVGMDTNAERARLVQTIIKMPEQEFQRLATFVAGGLVLAAPAEPKPAEPKPAEPKPAEPKPAEPKPAAPGIVSISEFNAALESFTGNHGRANKAKAAGVRAGMRALGIEPSTGSRPAMIKTIVESVGEDTRRAAAVLAAMKAAEAEALAGGDDDEGDA